MNKNFFEGKISVNSKGTGFVQSPLESEYKGEDIMIDVSKMNTALHGDMVEVAVLPDKQFNRIQGEVVRVITREKMQFVGTVDIKPESKAVWLMPDDRRMYMDILLPKESTVGRLENGTKVLVEIFEWVKGKNPAAKVLKVIGKKGEHNTEMESIILEKGFESGFPPEVEKEADEKAKAAFPVTPEELARRKDFRTTLTFTIDPKDAKDFDDALSFKKIANNRYEIGVHIADVSHYVTPGSALDKEAIKRGCSVYLVDRTIPMLPHALSNDICSLNPNEDRMAFSAVFEMDAKGQIFSKWFGKTVIHSHQRFTYENAQDVINGDSSCIEGNPFKQDLEFCLPLMNCIAKIYIQDNRDAGAINFETEEVKFELDEKGVPLRVIKKHRLDTHKMIEQYMLLANKEVAEYMWNEDKKMKGKEAGLIYRTHDVPKVEKIKDLAMLVRALGYNLELTKEGEVTAKALNMLLKQIEGTPEENLIRTASVRSMSKAIYTTSNTGHFGLAFEYYTHFTSPIRRYPDLLVHRIMQTYLTSNKLTSKDVAFFAEAAASSTEREISASDAERSSIKYKQVEYWAPRIGTVLNGVISGVTEWGVYVEEDETKAEGMIRLKAMKDDQYTLNEKQFAIIGQKTGKKISLGDKVKMKLTGADLDKKSLDFEFVD